MSNFPKKVSTTATNRLKQDYLRLNRDPVPYVNAVPIPNNILIWHYVVTGPENSLYEGGYFHGKLVFPNDFPFKPPAIYMITPNGRFEVNKKLCLSISDFHPDTWNPSWSVSTILTGLLSFMLETTPTTGSIESSDMKKRKLAKESLEFNLRDNIFCELFPDLVNTFNTIISSSNRINEAISNGDNKLISLTNQTNTNDNINPNEQQLGNKLNVLQKNDHFDSNLIFHSIFIVGLIAITYVLYNLNG